MRLIFVLKILSFDLLFFDFPATRYFFKNSIAQFHLEDRINFIGGNFLKDTLKGSYDIVWLSHILHSAGPLDCLRIIRNALSVLEPGGMIIVHDFILNNTMDSPLFPALFSLRMLLCSLHGQSYSERQIKNMLTCEGVGSIRRIQFRSFNDSGVIIGIKNKSEFQLASTL